MRLPLSRGVAGLSPRLCSCQLPPPINTYRRFDSQQPTPRGRKPRACPAHNIHLATGAHHAPMESRGSVPAYAVANFPLPTKPNPQTKPNKQPPPPRPPRPQHRPWSRGAQSPLTQLPTSPSRRCGSQQPTTAFRCAIADRDGLFTWRASWKETLASRLNLGATACARPAFIPGDTRTLAR